MIAIAYQSDDIVSVEVASFKTARGVCPVKRDNALSLSPSLSLSRTDLTAYRRASTLLRHSRGLVLITGM